MRLGFGVLTFCLWAVWSVTPLHAASTKAYGEDGIKISIPATWKALDQQIREQVSRQGGGKVILLAEAPQPETLKLTVVEAPASMGGLTNEILGAGQDADIKKVCAGYIEMVKKNAKAKNPACGRVQLGPYYAFATSFTSDAEGARPELGSSTWIFPRGDKSTIVTFLYQPGDKKKYQSLMQQIVKSLTPGPAVAR